MTRNRGMAVVDWQTDCNEVRHHSSLGRYRRASSICIASALAMQINPVNLGNHRVILTLNFHF